MAPADEPLEGRVVPEGVRVNADHWPAFRRGRLPDVVMGEIVEDVRVIEGPVRVWHDEASRLEARGRLDRAGCECDSCLGDKYSGEDFY